MSVSFLRRVADCIICAMICFVAIMGFSVKNTVAINAKGDLSVINHGDRSTQCVGLCFGVYGNSDNVEKILQILKEKNARATFFVGGCWADDNGKLLCSILDNGCELANFGYFNTDLKRASQSVVKDEITLCHNIVKALSGYCMKLFCPPSFSYSGNTLKIAEKSGYKTVICKKNLVQTADESTATLFKRATDNLIGGDFIMLYPTDCTVAVLERIITYFENAGLKAQSVSECL